MMSTRVILIELPGGESLAVGLAEAGHSLGLAFGAHVSESDLNELQLKLEQAGGISLAVNLDAGIDRAINRMIDFFGRIDAVACFTNEASEKAAKAISTFPARQRPSLLISPTISAF